MTKTKRNPPAATSGIPKPPELNETVALAGIIERAKTWRQAIQWVGYFSVAWCAKEAILGLSGKETLVSVIAEINKATDSAMWISTASGLVLMILLIGERRLRLRKIKELSARNAELELKLDPNRTSSGLTVSGETNPRLLL